MAEALALDDEGTIAVVAVAFDGDATSPAVETVNPSIEFTAIMRRNPHHINADIPDSSFFTAQGKIKGESTLEQPEGEGSDEDAGAEEEIGEGGHILFLSLWWKVTTAMKLSLSGKQASRKKKGKPAALAVQPAKKQTYFSSWKAKRLTQAMAMVETTKTMCTTINLVR